ncbi:helicase HerA domain-containing protein [Capnocytophaga leadbetteri]|jgi:hypothetical protein|uniref:ATP-binding protein n=1 Tax=Capnocytophaga leadbetteri TaxID=327575 RepID=UPI0028ECFB2A|nr:DUF87 domain-containing protein [Capnocytophaga leadbetteri]
MSSIYDKKENIEILDGGRSEVPQKATETIATPTEEVEEVQHTVPQSLNKEIVSYQERAMNAMQLVDDIVLKNYLTQLSAMDIVPIRNDLNTDEVILFKINKMVYEKDEYATDKFISVVSAMTYTHSSIYLIVDGHKNTTDFYLGIKCEDEQRGSSSVAETFKSAILGQFPGVEFTDYSHIEVGAKFSKQDKLLHRITEAASVSLCVGVPSYKNSKGEYTNTNFIQGIEKFALAMQGKEYTAVILASNIPNAEIANIRQGYEQVYTELSAMATQQLAYSTNESLANAMSRTKGYSDTVNQSYTQGTSDAEGTSSTHTEGTSSTTTHTKGTSEGDIKSKLSTALLTVGGALLVASGVGAPAGAALLAGAAASTAGAVGAGALGIGGILGGLGKQKSESTSVAEGTNTSDAYTTSHTHTTNESHTEGTSHSENFSETDGTTSTIGSGKQFTMTIQNKHIVEVQKRIDKQLERLELCESTGLWSAGAYFMSYDTDRATAEIAATIFRSIMQGEQSGVESSAINTWYPETTNEYKSLVSYIGALSHPIFQYQKAGTIVPLLPTSLLSSKEVAMLLGLPRKSVPGLPVVEHISLAKEVVRLGHNSLGQQLQLGCIFDQGVERSLNKVCLDTKSLTQHTFVTGSTGSGKSNTIYYLINQIYNQPNAPKFLVIEPAKGEYKDVFGNVNVYGTNPFKTPLLKINPFKFPKGVHVLEHIDRLVEIFNVCWPMYAAMPAVLKEAVLKGYEDCGWDLYTSQNEYGQDLFPTFTDLLNELTIVINNSSYSEEVKSNYHGALSTRIKSLTNGIYKQLFSGDELGDEALFDNNVIVDLSRVGSQETKSLIMGILIMRLGEYRANSGIAHNSVLRHITVLEEAHNILKRTSQEQNMEGSNVAGKSVEMLSNAIAEMRTYGEGFIIVDQSPGAVDISAIRNTNTKIIMRLPEDSDRKIAGKASGMKEDEVDEIAKLPTGVAVVYQNDWEAPVLCKISKFEGEEIPFTYTSNPEIQKAPVIQAEVLKLLLKGRIANPIEVDIDAIEKELPKSELSTSNKIIIYELIKEFKEKKILNLWYDDNFKLLSQLVTEIVAAKPEVEHLTNSVANFEELTQRLTKLIQQKVEKLPQDLLLVTSQCLMRDYSLANKEKEQVYGAWYQFINSKIN